MKKRPCCKFCHLTPVTKDNIPDDIKYRIIDVKERYFAILDKAPKIMGHILVISQEHYNDVLDDDLRKEQPDLVKDIFAGALEIASWLKDRLHAKKVYIVTMCEHWGGKNGTEHLHFHLIPQYEEKPIEGRSIVAEDLIARKGISISQNWFKEILRYIADRVNPNLKQIRKH